MKVRMKDFAVEMEIKNTGIELEVKDTQNKHLGDLVVTKTNVIWCQGKTGRAKGKTLTWPKFIRMMNEIN